MTTDWRSADDTAVAATKINDLTRRIETLERESQSV